MLIYQTAIANIKVTVREVMGLLGKDHVIAIYIDGKLFDTKGHFVRQRAIELADGMLEDACDIEHIELLAAV